MVRCQLLRAAHVKESSLNPLDCPSSRKQTLTPVFAVTVNFEGSGRVQAISAHLHTILSASCLDLYNAVSDFSLCASVCVSVLEMLLLRPESCFLARTHMRGCKDGLFCKEGVAAAICSRVDHTVTLLHTVVETKDKRAMRHRCKTDIGKLRQVRVSHDTSWIPSLAVDQHSPLGRGTYPRESPHKRQPWRSGCLLHTHNQGEFLA